MSTWSQALLDLLICVGLLVVMPLGLRLLPASGLAGVRRLWFAAAAPAAVSVWLPRGWLAAVLAAAYLPAAAALLLSAARVVLSRRLPLPRTVAVATALAGPTVAGCALVAERAGVHLFGFDLDVLALTVAHFHYAGFAAALVAGLVCGVDGDGPAGRLAAVSVPAGIAVVFAGFFTGEWVELAGAALLTAGMWLVGWLTWRRARAGAATRGLLVTSAVTLTATMVLALVWALGQAADLPHLPLSWMVATHGLANALGFALCALIAWQRIGAGSEWGVSGVRTE
ncbi:hypothetical protein GCM10022251_63700 [Phytohabitans flavus]|uniref:YndJ-like protein n=1 Tax=Phytohabitans flavus TaxID=1076124 RepID=A0A6F8XUZ8_9ACTN|nr:YndJ family protein [Phytohabitans flavus]BCB77653.1 hypothetical protein Pflav_040630 [Phytohabitans flavus]